VEKPSFQLSGISLSLRSMTTLNGAIIVAVHNPNFYDLTLNGAEYRIKLGEASLAEGVSRESVKIPGKTQRDINIPLQAESGNIGPVFKMYISGKDVPYEIEGAVYVKVMWTDLRIPFSKTGVLNIRS
jgi:LEA14-like dessication related protein